MSTDRDEALRRAESLLRQGQLDPAIAEYSRLVEASPNDLVLLNTLGDLFVRAGVSERAVPLYMRVADAHMTEGFYARAAGYYKKILKFLPTDEGVVLKLADASIRQGLRAEARKHLQAVANARHRRRDTKGLIPVLERLDDLDPADLPTRMAAVRALVPLLGRASLDRLSHLAAALEEREQYDDALALWREARRADPAAPRPAVRLAKAAMADGDIAAVVALLEGAALDDVDGVIMLVEAHLAGGDRESARAALDAFIARHPGAAGVLGDLIERVGAGRPSLPEASDRTHVTMPSQEGALALDVETDELVEPVLSIVDAAVVVEAVEVDPLLDEDEEGDLRVDVLSVDAVDVLPLLDEEAETFATIAPASRLVEVEVDLTDRLEAAARELESPRGQALPTATPSGRGDLDQAFASLREQVVERAEDLLGLGRTYLAAGLFDQAVEAFSTAARDAAQAYEAAAALAELYESRGDARNAVHWLERAAAGAPSAARRGAVLYRLGVTLERLGESGRALTVLQELKAMAPGFRDVADRVTRLEAAGRGGGSSSR